jgi:hypothetical protein
MPCLQTVQTSLPGRMPDKNAAYWIRARVELESLFTDSDAQEEARCDGTGLAEMERNAGPSKWRFHRVLKDAATLTPNRIDAATLTPNRIDTAAERGLTPIPHGRLGKEVPRVSKP